MMLAQVKDLICVYFPMFYCRNLMLKYAAYSNQELLCSDLYLEIFRLNIDSWQFWTILAAYPCPEGSCLEENSIKMICILAVFIINSELTLGLNRENSKKRNNSFVFVVLMRRRRRVININKKRIKVHQPCLRDKQIS